LYRRAPSSGEVSVTLALTGIGTAQFDDVRIEPLLSTGKPPVTSSQSGPTFAPATPSGGR
jgi:hypothetical protein